MRLQVGASTLTSIAIRWRVDADEIVFGLVPVIELDESRAAATPTIQPRSRLPLRRRSAQSALRWGPHKNCHIPGAVQFANKILGEVRVAANIPAEERQFLKVHHPTD